MEEMKALLEAAWAKVEPTFKHEPWRLQERLARRRSKTFSYTPRAWCLAIRAGDRRLNEMKFSRRGDVSWEGKKIRRGHLVHLDAAEVRKLCTPYVIPKPGLSVRALAKDLGMDLAQVRQAVKSGVFRVEPSQGVRGRKQIRLYTPRLIDPANIRKPMEDPGWGQGWRWVSEWVRDDLNQVLERRELPCKGPPGRLGRWAWVCPACGKSAGKLFCPVRWPQIVNFVRWTPTDGLDDLPQPTETFACHSCHKVVDNGRTGTGGWNDLVTYLSGGLLYGHEVERPTWWGKERKKKFARRRRTSKVRPEVERLLIQTDLTNRQIAMEVGVTYGTVCTWSVLIYRDWGVKGRQQIKEKGKSLPMVPQTPAIGAVDVA
jgi:hypothetical protein